MPTDYSKLTDAEVLDCACRKLGLRHYFPSCVWPKSTVSRAVLDAMVERDGWRVDQCGEIDCDTKQVWWAIVITVDGSRYYFGESRILDRAICEAALQAMEAEDA